MTDRDEFARTSLIALMSSPFWVKGADDEALKRGETFKHFVAGEAFAMADEMISASLRRG